MSTGTPIAEGERDTRRVFGDDIDVYDLHRAVEDGATVPVSFEPRLITLARVEGVDDDAPVTPGPRHSELPPNPGQHSPTSPGSAPQPPSGQEDPSGWEPPHDWRPPSWGGPEETPGSTTSES